LKVENEKRIPNETSGPGRDKPAPGSPAEPLCDNDANTKYGNLRMNRPAIPKKLLLQVIYESAFKCVVCQSEGCQIHHIDQDRTNNVESNLVALCPSHHGEAHTKRDHSRNLDPPALLYAKAQWTSVVREHREKCATVIGQRESVGESSILATGITWGYINHARVANMSDVDHLMGRSKAALDYCVANGIVDTAGIIIKPNGLGHANSPNKNTVYDWFPFGDDQRLHLLYTGMVDQISARGTVIHLESESWNHDAVESLIDSGTLIFTRAPFAFKNETVGPENIQRRVRTSQNSVTLEFFVDTINMFGDTSIYVSFVGRKTASALVIVKDISVNKSGEVIISASPLAMGVGFQVSLPTLAPTSSPTTIT
jgi:hypothetical protein